MNAYVIGAFVVILIASNIHSYKRGKHIGFIIGKASGALEATVRISGEYFKHIVSVLKADEEIEVEPTEEQKGA